MGKAMICAILTIRLQLRIIRIECNLSRDDVAHASIQGTSHTQRNVDNSGK
jgi:hypothetical protein